MNHGLFKPMELWFANGSFDTPHTNRSFADPNEKKAERPTVKKEAARIAAEKYSAA